MQIVEQGHLFLPRLKTQPEAPPAFVSEWISFHLEAKLIGGVFLIFSMNMQVPPSPNHIFTPRPIGWEELSKGKLSNRPVQNLPSLTFSFVFFFPLRGFEQA